MKPAKSFYPFAAWIIRLTMLLFVFVYFLDTIQSLNYKTINFYIATSFAVFAVLLFIGGFLTKPAMTVFSAFILCGLSIYEFIIHFQNKPTTTTVIFAFAICVSLVLFSVGNKK